MALGSIYRAAFSVLLITPVLATAQATTVGAAEAPWIDTSNRAEVLAAYDAEFDRTEPAIEFTGDVATCDAGTTSQAFRDSVVDRVNWYRRMAGLSPVTERSAYSTVTQQASTMMSAEGSLTHAPGAGWACYTPDGAAAAGSSNLALGVNGIGAIDAYIQDRGASNVGVGHRRTILYPQLLEVGTGDVPSSGPGSGTWDANTLQVFDDNLWGTRPSVREARDFVAWPPSGYVPPNTVWGRWSFSLAGADFSTATVTVADDLGPVQVSVIDRIQGSSPSVRIAPEPSIVWAIGDDTTSALLPVPTSGDECYVVTVAGVLFGGAVQPAYSYMTCVIDPDFDSSGAGAGSGPGPLVDCDVIDYAAWTVPCWRASGTLAGFTDVVSTWQREPVAWLVGNGITTGVSPGRFDPDGGLTRAQAATFIWRLAGSPQAPAGAPMFSDVAVDAWYHDAVQWMASYEITVGTGNGRFSPGATASRAEFVTFLWRLVDKPSVSTTSPFTDLTADWQLPGVRWAVGAGITTGTSGTSFSPDDAVTRGQAAALLARFGAAFSN